MTSEQGKQISDELLKQSRRAADDAKNAAARRVPFVHYVSGLNALGSTMPLVTITLRKPKSSAFKATVLDAVHSALVSSGVPAADLFQRVIELGAEDFRFDPAYPDVKTARNEEFALIEILWSVGRSVKVKKKLLAELMEILARAGFDTENVMVCFKETSWENWSFAGGRLIHT